MSSNSTPSPAPRSGEKPKVINHELLDKEGVRALLNLPSIRKVDDLVRKRKIPFIRLGHKTLRFSPKNVLRAIEKLEVREIGRQQ